MKRLTYFVAHMALALLVVGCSVEVTEKQRISNATSSIDAVVAIKETNATVATPTEVYVLPKGQKISGDPVFRADNVAGLRLVWDNESQLTIHADKARVFLNLPISKIDVPGKSHQMAIDIRLEIKDLK